MRAAIAMAIAVAVAGCRQGGRAGVQLVEDAAATYPAATPTFPPAIATTAFGRGQRPSLVTPVSTAGALPWSPILVERVWPVPAGGDDDAAGEALAVVSGAVDDRLVAQLIAVDAGEIRWHTGACAAPVVHVTGDVVVCADANRTLGLDVATGRVRWRQPMPFGGAEGDLIVGHPGRGRIAVISAGTGVIVAEIAAPPGVDPLDVRRACARPGGTELWAWTPGGRLQRFVAGGDGALGELEQIALPRPPARVDACTEPALIEIPIPGSAERLLHAVAPGAPLTLGDPVVERGFWRGAAGAVVVATADGIEVRDRALALVRRTSDAQVGRELSARGRRRLVRGAAGLPVLLEDDRPIAYLGAPSHPGSAVLGDHHVLGGGWQPPARTLADRPHRFRLPALPVGAPAVLVPPILPAPAPEPIFEARDLPDRVAPLDPVIELAGAGVHGVGAVFLDPSDPAVVYVAPLERQPDAAHGAGLAALDLRTRRWLWHAPQGCPPRTPVAVAVARDVVVCGARGPRAGGAEVRAIARADGTLRWSWPATTIDAVAAAGGLVVVAVGGIARIVDAVTGASLGDVVADDGFAPRAVPVVVRGTDVVVTVERGAVVARLPRARMLPLWAAAVTGVVAAVGIAGDRVTVELTGGELYLLDAATGRAVAAGGWGRRWRPVTGSDLVLAEPLIPTGEEWRLTGFGVDGAPRFAAGLAVEPPWLIGARAVHPAAPLALAYGPAAQQMMVLDPATGEVAARAALPDRAVPGATFATVVDGTPVAGAVLSQPLGVVVLQAGW
jgi:hypothetical protein